MRRTICVAGVVAPLKRLSVSFAMAVVLSAIVSAQQGGANISVLPALGTPPNASDAYLKSDQLAQKQVEGSLAFSTRNPLHGIAAFNDYRAVSIAEQGLGEQASAGFLNNSLQWLARMIFHTPSTRASVSAAGPEAWVGTSFTYDGITWSGGFVPGAPFDNSPASLASPVKAKSYQAATDPWVVSAPCGRLHVVFVPFTRFQGSAVAVANYVDNNNLDGKHTIQYLGTTLIDTANNATNGPFHDLPFAIVDPTRATTGDPCDYKLYVSWTTFSGNDTTRINIARSLDRGGSFTKGFVSSPAKTNQRAVIAVDPRQGTPKTTGGGTLYVGFRSFDPTNAGMWVSKSADYGDSFDKAVKLNGTPLYPFDQNTQPTSQFSVQETTFRTNAYMTLQAVPLTNGGMTLFAGWSERVNLAACSPAPTSQCGRPAANGEPRIVMMKSTDGKAQVWTDLAGAPGQRMAVDFLVRDSGGFPGLGYLYQPRGSGPQIQPHLTFAEGRFGLLYLESRAPLVGSAGVIAGLDPSAPAGDWRGPLIDARFAVIDPATGGLLGTNQISRYPVKATGASGGVDTLDDIAEVTNGSPSKRANYKATFPNSGGGASPFFGDYTAVAPVVQYVLDKTTNRWRWATQPGDQPYPGFHAMWADSRNLLPPAGTPTQQAQKSPNFNAASMPACSPDLGGSRNHDVMTSLVNTSVLISAPTTFKVGPIQRAFPVTVSNAAKVSKFFRLTFSAPDIASFDQSSNIDQLDLQLLPFSSSTPVAYLDATATGAETVTVAELDLGACPVPSSLTTCPNPPIKVGGQTGSVTLNLDPTNPVFQNGANATTEKHNPLVTSPLVTSPLVTSPLVTSPMVTSPLVTSSGQANPLVTSPLVTSPLVTSSAPSDWNGGTTNYTWTVTGDADAVNSSIYTQISLDNTAAPGSYSYELRIYRRTSTTMVVSDPDPASPTYGKCISVQVPQEELISSIPNPMVTSPLVTSPFIGDNAKNPLVTSATFTASPPDGSSGSSSSSLMAAARAFGSSSSTGDDLRDVRDNRTYVTLLAYWRGGTNAPPPVSTPAIALVPASTNIVNGVPDPAPSITYLAPDLIVDGVPTFTPGSVIRGSQIQLSWVLKNNGNANASAADGAFSNSYYLSADAALDANDVLLGSDTEATPAGTPFAPGAAQAFLNRPLTIPAGTAPGTYRLIIKVDSGGEIPESNEANNVFVVAGTLQVTQPGTLFAATDTDEFNSQSNSLARISVTGSTVTGTTLIPTSFPMNGLADGGGFLYSGDPYTNTFRKVDYNGNLISSIGAAGFPNAAFNEDFAFDGTTFYHVHYDADGGQIDKINPATGDNLATYVAPCTGAATASAPVGATFVGSQVWISCWDAGQVGTWDPATNTFTPKFSVPSLAGALAYDPNYQILWVGRSGGFIAPYDLSGNLVGGAILPFGEMPDTIDGLEFIPTPVATTIDFESPSLDGADRRQISPYTALGVTFTAEPGGFGDEVVGLVRNAASSTSACVPPESAAQLLGTGRSSFTPDGDVGLSGFAIRATFPGGGLSAPRTISVDVEARNDATARLRLFDSTDTLLATTSAAPPATGTCSGGVARGTATLTATASSGTVAYAIVDTVSGGFVFVIDNFKIQ